MHSPPSKNFCKNVLCGRSLLPFNNRPIKCGSCFQKFIVSWYSSRLLWSSMSTRLESVKCRFRSNRWRMTARTADGGTSRAYNVQISGACRCTDFRGREKKMSKINVKLHGRMETHPTHPFAIEFEHTFALVNRACRLCRCSSEACWYSRHCRLELTHSTTKSISEYPGVGRPVAGTVTRFSSGADLTSSEPLLL
jgi:hypothetical protein